MTRRITAAMLGVTEFVLLAIGIPLAVVVQRSIVSSAVVELQADAAGALNEIETPIDQAQLIAVADEADAPPPFAVYDRSGALVFGAGPTDPDGPTGRALAGQVATSTDGDVVVAAPIVTRDEQVLGALRMARPRHELQERTLAAWAVMLGAALVALGAAWLLARRVPVDWPSRSSGSPNGPMIWSTASTEIHRLAPVWPRSTTSRRHSIAAPHGSPDRSNANGGSAPMPRTSSARRSPPSASNWRRPTPTLPPPTWRPRSSATSIGSRPP